MTAARRPDGSGGPLSEDERIDDLQFYADPRADLLIDDIVLFDAGNADEKRPFPKRVLFTGWFDTGKQGKEWPGRFDIVPKKGYFWHAARSVEDADSGGAVLRVNLRGERPLGEATSLFFRYQLTGADSLRVTLANGKTAGQPVELKKLEQGRWAEATVDFAEANRPGKAATDLEFRLPKGAELQIDDLLLYVPGG
jgi:hypothetical protein